MRRLLILIVLFACSFLLISCEDNSGDYVVLPNLDHMSRAEIANKMESLDVIVRYHFVNRIYHNEDEYDQFAYYGDDFKSGKRVAKGSTIHIYTTALHLPTEDVAPLVMNLDYEGKDFVEDGVGRVTLARAVDGDTAHFYTTNGTYIKVRFLGVDTPESTMEKEAWGKAASNFTKNMLNNASVIVLEREEQVTDTYGRYLAFVWCDGVLMNLELVQNAYSNAKLSSSSKYYDAFFDTEIVICATGRRIWGEIDPDYDYENHVFK